MFKESRQAKWKTLHGDLNLQKEERTAEKVISSVNVKAKFKAFVVCSSSFFPVLFKAQLTENNNFKYIKRAHSA